MNRDERNRRERDRARRAAEMPEARRREYDSGNRRAPLTTEQRETINASKRERRQLNNLPAELVSSADLRQYRIIDDNIIMEKIKHFHTKLVFAIQCLQCSICLEHFPTIHTDKEGICMHCRAKNDCILVTLWN